MMAIQISYPGVYIEEFTPGAPIEGVGTNTAAFTGTATRGPINKPTLIQSWDAFTSEFGGFIAEQPASYLAPAVYGFFLNGGTACYIVRAGSGKMAETSLDSRQTGTSPDPILLARARQEGPDGNAISIQVINSSRLASLLAKALPPRAITAELSGGRKIVSVNSNAGYAGGEVITLTRGANSATMIVESTQDNDKLILAGSVPGTATFNGGEVTSAGVLTPWRAETTASAMSSDRLTLTVDSNIRFAPGDRILLTKTGTGGGTAMVVVKSKQSTDTLEFSAPIAGTINFGTGAVAVRTADLAPGQKILRLAIPPGLQLSQALPRGSAVSIALGTTSNIRIVESSGCDTITLKDGLENSYDMANSSSLPTVVSLEFTLVISDSANGTSETFDQVAMNPEHPTYWRSIVESSLVSIEEPTTPPTPMPQDPRPAVKTYTLLGGTADDRAAALADVRTKPNSYLDLLKPYDDVALVSVPGETDKNVQQAVIAHCETMWDRFAILDSIRGVEPGNGIRDQYADVRSQSGFAALYYPWILARNPLTGKDELWPPSGHIAGVFARTDAQQGVHKAPANTNIRGALGLERRLSDQEQGPLNLLGINAIRIFVGQSQPVVWGARTTATDRNWQYVNVRRLFLFLEESIQEGIRWGVFEPNNLQLWQKLKRTISEFLTRVWQDGALFGRKAEDAFYVRIDEALNPPSTQALGRLYIEIGVRPAYPAEFIIVRIGIWQGGSEIND